MKENQELRHFWLKQQEMNERLIGQVSELQKMCGGDLSANAYDGKLFLKSHR